MQKMHKPAKWCSWTRTTWAGGWVRFPVGS